MAHRHRRSAQRSALQYRNLTHHRFDFFAPAMPPFTHNTTRVFAVRPVPCYNSVMEPIITQHGPQIAELCQRFHVQRLEVFGSAASGAFDPQRSDVDFLVEFAPLVEGQHADAYFGLHESLAALIGRPVDLVMMRAIRNPYFLQAIEPSRTLLYAA